jgi:hypothetical protein
LFPVAENEPYRQSWTLAILVDMPAMLLGAMAAVKQIGRSRMPSLDFAAFLYL